MYRFIARYYNKDFSDLPDAEYLIEIDSIPIELTDRQIYVMAMEKAFDHAVVIGDAWGLGSVEFLSC